MSAVRSEKLAGQTLGALVNMMFATYVVPEGFERELLPDSEIPVDRATASFTYRVTLSIEQWDQTKAAIQKLVSIRNLLVHHFIAKFDLRSLDGCSQASIYLTQSYERIDQHFTELMSWAESMDKARSIAASFYQSEVFHDWMVNGIDPEGGFEWPHTGIVRALQESVRSLSDDHGWVELSQVHLRMAQDHPDQTPDKYKCRTWPQVVTESGQFDLAYRQVPNGQRVAWLRIREKHGIQQHRSKALNLGMPSR